MDLPQVELSGTLESSFPHIDMR